MALQLFLVASMVGAYGFYLAVRNMQKMAGELRQGLVIFSASSFTIILIVAIIALYGLLEINTPDPTWDIIPVIFFIASAFFGYSTKKLVDLLNELVREES